MSEELRPALTAVQCNGACLNVKRAWSGKKKGKDHNVERLRQVFRSPPSSHITDSSVHKSALLQDSGVPACLPAPIVIATTEKT